MIKVFLKRLSRRLAERRLAFLEEGALPEMRRWAREASPRDRVVHRLVEACLTRMEAEAAALRARLSC